MEKRCKQILILDYDNFIVITKFLCWRIQQLLLYSLVISPSKSSIYLHSIYISHIMYSILDVHNSNINYYFGNINILFQSPHFSSPYPLSANIKCCWGRPSSTQMARSSVFYVSFLLMFLLTWRYWCICCQKVFCFVPIIFVFLETWSFTPTVVRREN